MAKRTNKTIFQSLSKALNGGYLPPISTSTEQGQNYNINSYNISNDDVIYRSNSKADVEREKLQLRQQQLLANQWYKANVTLAQDAAQQLTGVKLMYRDADLMDLFPEIGTALDIITEEACCVSDEGKMVNVFSKSERVRAILEDLYANRLDIHTTLPMICRGTCKYGNEFHLLNLSKDNGVMGWRQLPVYEMERYDIGVRNPYIVASAYNTNQVNINETTFVWVGRNEYIPYRNWQIAHFRLLYDSLYLPMGISYLHKARRHWRMLSMMEDMMLIYRLERSIERRVYKIYVGTIDDQDIPAFIQQVSNNFKRTPIIDPLTGQLDLRKNFPGVDQDIFIPVRDSNAPTPIDTLPSAQNLTAIDDIKYIQNKVLTALKIPKPFLNFEENTGDGKNLSLLDIRFSKTINRIQQALIMELTKIGMIHLYLLGFHDDLNNFTLTMNNPSSQVEMMNIDNMAKKIDVVKNATSDAGNGIPVLSWTRALKKILKMTDKEITENLEEIRLEKAIAGELLKTWDIIKRTHIFDPVDNIYGEPDAEYSATPPGQDDAAGGMPGGGGGGGGIMPDMGSEPVEGDLDLSGDGDLSGEEGSMDMNAAVADENADNNNPIGEAFLSNLKNKLLIERGRIKKQENIRNENRSSFVDIYKTRLTERALNKENKISSIPIFQKNFLINEEINNMVNNLDSSLGDDDFEDILNPSPTTIKNKK